MVDQQPNKAGWNAQRSNVWVDLQPMLDRLFSPFERILVDEVTAQGACNVLDIGCGAGATTLALAQHLAEDGGCTGVDISQELVDAAIGCDCQRRDMKGLLEHKSMEKPE